MQNSCQVLKSTQHDRKIYLIPMYVWDIIDIKTDNLSNIL